MLLVQIHGKYQQDHSWETKLPRSVLKIRMLFSVVQWGGGIKNGRGKHRISAAVVVHRCEGSFLASKHGG